MRYIITLIFIIPAIAGECDPSRIQTIDSSLAAVKRALPAMRENWERAQLLYEEQIRRACRLDSMAKKCRGQR